MTLREFLALKSWRGVPTEWWAPAVGRVKSSGTLGAPVSTSYEIDLVSYKIP